MVNFSNLKKLCTPAWIYLVMSAIILILLAFQNLGNYTTFCIGDVECDVDNTWFIFFLKIVYVIFWTFILNLLCKDGYTNLSWILLLLPFILAFVILGLIIFNNNPRKKNKL